MLMVTLRFGLMHEAECMQEQGRVFLDVHDEALRLVREVVEGDERRYADRKSGHGRNQRFRDTSGQHARLSDALL
jgi:hypothetical protein